MRISTWKRPSNVSLRIRTSKVIGQCRSQITVEEVFAQMCINRCPKQDLRRKYLELSMTPNFSQIITIAKGHEGNLKGAPKPFNNYENANTQKPKSPKKQKNTPKRSIAAQKPKTDGSYLGCIRCGAIDHFPRDCKFISHKCFEM